MLLLPVLLTAPLSLTALLLAPAAPSGWDWPVDPPHRIVRPFEAPATRYSAGHRGIDISSPVAASVRAPAAGVVHFAGVVVDRPVLSLEHPGGYLTSYEPVTTHLTAGERVARGQPIGRLDPGHCTSPCLHFGVRLDGQYLSPLLLLGEIRRAVLLPMSAAALPASGPRMSRPVALLEPFGRNVRIQLGCAQARVPQHLLDRPKVRSPVEEVRRGGVPQGVGAGGPAARNRGQERGDEFIDGTGPDAPSPGAQEQGRG